MLETAIDIPKNVGLPLSQGHCLSEYTACVSKNYGRPPGGFFAEGGTFEKILCAIVCTGLLGVFALGVMAFYYAIPPAPPRLSPAEQAQSDEIKRALDHLDQEKQSRINQAKEKIEKAFEHRKEALQKEYMRLNHPDEYRKLWVEVHPVAGSPEEKAEIERRHKEGWENGLWMKIWRLFHGHSNP